MQKKLLSVGSAANFYEVEFWISAPALCGGCKLSTLERWPTPSRVLIWTFVIFFVFLVLRLHMILDFDVA